MQKFRKAYTAAGVTFVGGLAVTLADGTLTTGSELLACVSAGLLAGVAVYKVKNAD